MSEKGMFARECEEIGTPETLICAASRENQSNKYLKIPYLPARGVWYRMTAADHGFLTGIAGSKISLKRCKTSIIALTSPKERYITIGSK